MISNILEITLIILVLIILLIDFIPIFEDWIGRIHIGSYQDIKSWNESVLKIGVKWLKKTPKIKVTDNSRFIVMDIIRGNYSRKTIQYWQEASLLLGISEYLTAKEDIITKDKVKGILDSHFDKNGQWIQKPLYIDAAIFAYAVMNINFINIEDYRIALDYVYNLIIKNKGIDGTVEYRKHMEEYRYVDTIGFICPFLVLYGIKFNKNESVELAIKQIKEYEKYGMLNDQFIPSHAYNIKTKIPVGLFGWGRGLGWYALGLIDSWRELPDYNVYKSILEKSIKKLTCTVLNLQQPNGSWTWASTRNEARPDSSTVAILSWFLLNASKINGFSEECLDGSQKALKYLMKVTRRNGEVDFSQGDTKDIGVYSMAFNIMPFTQGLCIRTSNLFLG